MLAFQDKVHEETFSKLQNLVRIVSLNWTALMQTDLFLPVKFLSATVCNEKGCSIFRRKTGVIRQNQSICTVKKAKFL
jgi:hypothetical protein